MAFYKLFYQYRRLRFQPKARGTVLQPLYEQPIIESNQAFNNTRFLVIDCEMSGLDINTCQLLSIGWVVIEHGRIINSSGKHMLIHADRGTGDSSRIHGLLDNRIAGANSAASALMLLAKQMQNSVLVFHHAPLDMKFLQKASIENFRCPLIFSYVDTMEIERRRIQMQGKHSGLRLSQSRQRYGLVDTAQHNALADAQATAELLLAQVSYLKVGQSLSLADLKLSCAH